MDDDRLAGPVGQPVTGDGDERIAADLGHDVGLGTCGLDDLDGGAETVTGFGDRQMLRPDAHHDRLPLRHVQAFRHATRAVPSDRRTAPVRKFMDGEPMNPATNRLTGWS